MFRWIGKSRRRICCVVLVPLMIVAGPPVWWAMQLMALPDIGDPFDVAAFRSFTVSDDRNAFVLYYQAGTMLKPFAEYFKTQRNSVELFARWSKADAQLRRLVEENREALAVYRQGAERPDALDPAVGSDRESYESLQAGLCFRVIVLLEASRLEDQGDMAAAWGWYRAMVRTIHHVGMRGSVQSRSSIQRWYGQLRDRMATWAADPRTSPAQLRQALADVVARGALAPSERDSLKASYLAVNSLLDSPKNLGSKASIKRFRRFLDPDYQLTREDTPGDLGRMAILAPRARTQPTGHPAGNGQLAGVSRPAVRESAETRSERRGV